MAERGESTVDTVRFMILLEAGLWMKANKFEDMTQIDDEYILRQLAKFGCFSIRDVIRELNKLGEALAEQNPRVRDVLRDLNSSKG